MKKKTNKTAEYRRIIENLKKSFFGGDYEDFSCGNTMGLYVKNPWKCIELFEKFDKIKRKI